MRLACDWSKQRSRARPALSWTVAYLPASVPVQPRHAPGRLPRGLLLLDLVGGHRCHPGLDPLHQANWGQCCEPGVTSLCRGPLCVPSMMRGPFQCPDTHGAQAIPGGVKRCGESGFPAAQRPPPGAFFDPHRLTLAQGGKNHPALSGDGISRQPRQRELGARPVLLVLVGF